MKIGTVDSPYIRRYEVKEKGYEYIRSLGYDCIDYQNFLHTEDPIFQTTAKEFDAAVAIDRKIIENAGLTVHQVHAPWRWPAQDATPEERQERFEKMAISIRGTALLGSQYMVIHPLMPWGGASVGPEPEKFWEINEDFMGRLCRIAEKNNVIICFENMPMTGLPISSPEASLAFVKKIDSPWFKCCLDTGHCAVFGIQPAEAVRLYGKDFLKVLHVHDNNGVADWHWVPFTGMIDWDDFKKALTEIGYDGCLSLESAAPAKFTGENLLLQDRSLVLSARQLAGKE